MARRKTQVMSEKIITRKEALAWIAERFKKGLMFRIRFIKRTTNELREMTARQGVTSKLHGGEAAYDFEEHGLLPVFDMQKNAYRTIPIEGITGLLINDEWVEVVDGSNAS